MTKNARRFALYNDTWLFDLRVQIGGAADKFEADMCRRWRCLPSGRDFGPELAGAFFGAPGQSRGAIWFRRTPDAGTLAHEALHAAAYVLREKGVGPLTTETEEAYTYLQDWIVTKIRKRIERRA